jgi:uncharacterized protein YggU (UPF0235/DUF167 family)
VLISVQVKLGSAKAPIVEELEDGSLLIHVKERAIDGAANDGVIGVLAKYFGVGKSKVTIKSGHTARIKRVTIDK